MRLGLARFQCLLALNLPSQNAKIKSSGVWLRCAYIISGLDWSEMYRLMRIHHLNRPETPEVTPESFCSLSRAAKARKNRCASEPRQPTDQLLEPIPGEIDAVRTMLAEIEKMLAGLF